MSSFKLQQEGLSSSTSIPNNFIEEFMPAAAGEFVKIYIYLLKCISENCSELSISRIADVFNDTEKDVTRALKYWEKKGLLKLSFNADNELTSLILTSARNSTETVVTREALAPVQAKEPGPSAAPVAQEPQVRNIEPRQYTRGELETFAGSEDNNLLIYAVQKLIGRQMTSADINTIMFMEDSLGFSEELIEYLFEYCAEKKKTSRRYIEKTAIAWAEQGIRDVKGAKLINALYSENCYPIMKAFGLTGRNPASSECRYIDRWFLSYGFGMDMVLEAVNRTISMTHSPSFEYADSILRNWKSEGIETIEAVRKADKEHAAKAAAGKRKSGTSNNTNTSSTPFNSFEQRTYDYEALEAKLINK